MCDWLGTSENDGFQFDGVYPEGEYPDGDYPEDFDGDPEEFDREDFGVYVLVSPFDEDEDAYDPIWDWEDEPV